MSSSTLGQRLSCRDLEQLFQLHVQDGTRVDTEKFTSRELMEKQLYRHFFGRPEGCLQAAGLARGQERRAVTPGLNGVKLGLHAAACSHGSSREGQVSLMSGQQNVGLEICART